MKHIIALCTSFLIFSCSENKKENTTKSATENLVEINSTSEVPKTIETTLESKQEFNKSDLSGKWTITKVTGGPVKIYPFGKSEPGTDLDFNMFWKNGIFEFINGVAFLAIPNVSSQEIGNYSVKNNAIIFENYNDEKQQMTFILKDNNLTLITNPEDYKKLISQKSNGEVEMEIASPIVFHLKK